MTSGNSFSPELAAPVLPQMQSTHERGRREAVLLIAFNDRDPANDALRI